MKRERMERVDSQLREVAHQLKLVRQGLMLKMDALMNVIGAVVVLEELIADERSDKDEQAAS